MHSTESTHTYTHLHLHLFRELMMLLDFSAIQFPVPGFKCFRDSRELHSQVDCVCRSVDEAKTAVVVLEVIFDSQLQRRFIPVTLYLLTTICDCKII